MTLGTSRRAGSESAPGFTFSLLFIIIPHSTTQLQYTNSYTYSHPNLNFLQYTIQILIPHLMWSAQVVCDSKIDHTQRHLSTLGGPVGAFREEQAMSRHWVSPSPFLSSSSHTTQLHYTNSYTYSHPTLTFLVYTILIFIPHVIWSAQAVCDS